MLRGGAFKPRTSPYSFQGMEHEGLKLLAKAREETGLPIVTEILSFDDVDLVAEYADVMQVGARNMQTFSLLKKLGKVNRPVLLKRGMSCTVKETLMSAEIRKSFCASAVSEALKTPCATLWIFPLALFLRNGCICRSSSTPPMAPA